MFSYSAKLSREIATRQSTSHPQLADAELSVKGTVVVTFLKNVQDPDQPAELNKRVNVYLTSIKEGYVSGYGEKCRLFVPGSVFDAIVTMTAVYIEGIVYHCYYRGLIIRPTTFTPHFKISTPIAWQKIILNGVGKLLFIHPSRSYRWRMFTVAMTTTNGIKKYFFNIDCVDSRGLIRDMNLPSFGTTTTLCFKGYVLWTPGYDVFDNLVLFVTELKCLELDIPPPPKFSWQWSKLA